MQHLIVYLPVLHRGYLNFLDQHHDVADVWILGDDLKLEFDQLRKDIRALSAAEMKTALSGFTQLPPVKILDKATLPELQHTSHELCMPDEDIMRELANKYFATQTVKFESVFLRWDKQQTLQQRELSPAEIITASVFDKDMMAVAQAAAEHSSDWWRRVGAVLVKDGHALNSVYNTHVPDQNQPYFNGDPRGNFHKGQYIELTTAFHAEAQLIAQAAKAGLSVAGCSLYVTTFPCPNCAKLIAYSGISKVFYQTGYAMVDGESILKEQGVKVIRVEGAG